MIEPKLRFLEVEIKSMLVNAPESRQSGFGYHTVGELRSLFLKPDCAGIVEGFYLNIVWNWDSVRVPYFVDEHNIQSRIIYESCNFLI